jgi:predicted aspartyl protease
MHSLRLIGLFLFTIPLVACAGSAVTQPAAVVSAGATRLPLQPMGTQPAVHAYVNDRGPYLFLVDTGASGMARIDSVVAQALGLPAVGEDEARGATVGPAVALRRVAVRSLRVGTREYRNLTPLSRSYNAAGEYLPDIGGILALQLFADSLLTIDFPGRELRIEAGALPPADNDTIFDYREEGGLIRLSFAVDGRRLEALVDTGTDRTLDLPTSVLRTLRLRSAPRPLGQSEGVTGRVVIAETVLGGDLVLGRHRISNPSVSFSEAFEFPVLGSGFFQDFTVTIDQRNRRIRLVRPGT